MQRANLSRQIQIVVGMAALLVIPLTLRSDSGPGHRIDQPFPISLGTSGGNIKNSSKAFCCGGTLGALVQAAGAQYILSNNHVLARTNLAALGESIIQPGLIDQMPVCATDANDAVADLSAFVPIQFKRKGAVPTNAVDAAIAQVRPGAVASDGSILDIGVISSETVAPILGMAVKKSGRTTGFTTGIVAAVNVTVDVTYSKTCGSGSQTARFVNQISVTPGTFIAGGDSGSLMVEDVTTAPRAVGLLFAGSDARALANPINAVLAAFDPDVSLVGSAPAASLLGRMFARVKKIWRVSEIQAASVQLPGQADPAAVDAVTRVKERHEGRLLGVPGVVGVGVGLSDRIGGQPVIEIYVKQATDSLRQSLPSSLEGVPVNIVETGEFFAH